MPSPGAPEDTGGATDEQRNDQQFELATYRNMLKGGCHESCAVVVRSDVTPAAE